MAGETTGDKATNNESLEREKKQAELLQTRIDTLLAKMRKHIDAKEYDKLGPLSAESKRLSELKQDMSRAGAAAWKDWQDVSGPPKSAAQENLELLGQKMQAAGMNNDTNTPAHEHEYYEGNAGNTPPPPPDTVTPPDGTSPLPLPETRPNPELERIRTINEKLTSRREVLNNAIKLFAKAKTRNESIRSFGSQHDTDMAYFAEAKNALDASFAEYASALAGQLRLSNMAGEAAVTSIQTQISELKSEHQVIATQEEADSLTQTLITLNSKLEEAQQANVDYEKTIQVRLNADLMEIRGMVDAEQLRQKYESHAWLAKMGEKWRKHPGWRMAANGALVVTGVAATAVGFAPGMALAAAGKAGMRGIGGYMAGSGAGGYFAGRRERKTTNLLDDAQRLENFDRQKGIGALTTSMQQEAGLRRRGKKAGAVAGLVSGVGGTLLQHNAAPKPGVSHAEIGSSPSQPTPEQLDAWERYFGMTSTSPDAAANFDAMSSATPAVKEAMKAGGVSLDQLTDPNWLKSNGITSNAARRAFNFRLGQASVSPDATARFMGDLPNYLNQLRGMK